MLNEEEQKKVDEIMKTVTQGAVNKMVENEKKRKRVSELKDKINGKNKEVKLKKHLITKPNPKQEEIDKWISEER